MQKLARLGFAGVAAAATLTLASGAFAQEASGEAGMTLPGAPGATATAGGSDHAAMSEHIGFGYLGARTIPIFGGGNLGDSVSAPVIGVRYWLDPSMGIDAGIGFVSTGGTVTSPPDGDESDIQGHTGFLLHAGVPLNLADAGHFSFQIVPELNVGFANSTIKDPDPNGNIPDKKLSGFGLDIGARAGAEIHFGFMGIPQLSLQGSVGVRFSMENRTQVVESDPEQESKVSSTAIGTTVGDNPWNIFQSNVAAMYYF